MKIFCWKKNTKYRRITRTSDLKNYWRLKREFDFLQVRSKIQRFQFCWNYILEWKKKHRESFIFYLRRNFRLWTVRVKRTGLLETNFPHLSKQLFGSNKQRPFLALIFCTVFMGWLQLNNSTLLYFSVCRVAKYEYIYLSSVQPWVGLVTRVCCVTIPNQQLRVISRVCVVWITDIFFTHAKEGLEVSENVVTWGFPRWLWSCS